MRPGDPEVPKMLARLHHGQGSPAKAIAVLEKHLEEHPGRFGFGLEASTGMSLTSMGPHAYDSPCAPYMRVVWFHFSTLTVGLRVHVWIPNDDALYVFITRFCCLSFLIVTILILVALFQSCVQYMTAAMNLLRRVH